MNREESHESHSLPPPPNSEKQIKKNVCFRLVNNTSGGNTMEWYVFNPNKSPSSSEKTTETHRRCSRCPRPHRFEKSDLASFAGLGKHCELTSFVILGSCIYCIGGLHDSIRFLRRVLRFDTNRPQEGWKKVAPMNKGRASPGTEVICGEIYVFGGYCYRDDVGPWAEVFDPVQDAWHALPEPPVNTKSLNHDISSVALEEDKKILVAFYSSACFLGCYSYHVSTQRWVILRDEAATFDCRAKVVERTVYWFNTENISAYDLDQKKWYFGRVKGLKREGILYDPKNGIDTPWLLHLGRENFGLICLGGVHKVSKSLFTCINCAVLGVSKSTKRNGKGILKLEITTQYVKSYFVEGSRSMLEPCLIEGMLEGDDGNLNNGNGSGTTVWGEISESDCACI